MFSRTRSLSSTITSFVLSVTFVTTVAAGVDFERIHQLLHLFHNATGIPGMAAGMVANGEPVFVRSYGVRDYADRESRVTTDTLFEIGSCTKAFTSYLVASLVREGRLAYEDPVIQHIHELRMSDAQITTSVHIKDLLDHASGLPGHDSVWYHANMSRNELLERLPHLPFSYGLREKYQYNNIMYAVAGIAIERVTKHSWEEEIRERILRPLNMTRSLTSFAELQQQPANADIATPHTTVRGGTATVALPPLDISMVAPAGSIHLSVNDMIKWIQFQMSDSVPKEMHVVKIPARSGIPDKAIKEGRQVNIGYGYGWLIHLYRGQYVIQHSGQTDGFCAIVSLFPEEKYAVMVLTNLDTVGLALHDLVLRISDIASNRSMSQSDEEWVKKVVPSSSSPYSDDSGLEKSVDQPERYTGRYHDAGYGVIEVSMVASNLSALYNNIRYVLAAKIGTDFFTLLPQSNARTDGAQKYDCSFARDSSGEVVALHVGFEPAVSPIIFEKQFSQALDLQYLDSFTGTFSSAATSVKIGLNHHEHLLIAKPVSQYEPEKLKPLKRNWFCTDRCTLMFEFVLESAKVSELLVHEGAEVLYVLKKKND